VSLISERLAALAPSATMALTARAGELRRAGRPVISFSAGEPDFASPGPVVAAAHAAIDAGCTRYAPTRGLMELREAVVAELESDTGTRRDPAQVVVSNGAKQVLFNLLQALVNPGESVAYAAPYWVSYPAMVQLAQGRSVVIPTHASEGFRLDPERLEHTLDAERPKVLVLNTPQNPTGAVYDPADVDAIVEACMRRGVVVIADEIYARLIFGDARHRSVLASDDEARRRLVVLVSGVSKSHAMTGWRIGYAVGPRPIIDAVVRLQGHQTSGACTISQHAAVAALRRGGDAIGTMRAAFEQRCDEVCRIFDAVPDLTLSRPSGTFYAFPNVAPYCVGRYGDRLVASDVELAELLLERAEIAAVPGSPFGAPGHLRFSFALSLDEIREGLGRFSKMLSERVAP
jgi:aspartate aminotransferase